MGALCPASRDLLQAISVALDITKPEPPSNGAELLTSCEQLVTRAAAIRAGCEQLLRVEYHQTGNARLLAHELRMLAASSELPTS